MLGKNFKKLLALLLVLAMVFSLWACNAPAGSGDGDGEGSGQQGGGQQGGGNLEDIDPDSMTAKELGQRLYLDSGTLTPVLRSLEEKGFIVRRRSHEDERVLIAKLTRKGAALREEALAVPYEVVHCVNFSAEEAAQLQQLLYKLLSALPE